MSWTPELEAELRARIVHASQRQDANRNWRTQCEGKHAFQNAAQAWATVRHADMNAFQCRVCGSWHVGHASRPRRLSNQARRERGRAHE